MAHVLKPPAALDGCAAPSVFLAGSIEMGTAEQWQARAERALSDLDDVYMLNPRRDDWDPSWVQSMSNELFCEQVEWELSGLERADVVAVYFAPDTRAPVTLLELGLFANSGKLVVLCPDGYWRKGNVDIVCRRYDIERVDDFDALMRAIRRRLAGC
ncbi:nucleoside 2-deoxyribosyltransferase domain-containing protein [Haliangium sp.]|uniref:nucleoside 2-deoxyribosyltransferase domain-containing protein n=1 Tax=Haliangium sp. TaxID=2663208 RepID=UPI003D125D37